MKFGEIFEKSWSEYKTNLEVILKTYGLFLFLPALATFLVMFFGFPEYFQMQDNWSFMFNGSRNLPDYSISFLSIMFILSIASFLLSNFFTAGLIYFSLNKDKKDFNKFMSGGKKYFWSFLGFSIALMLALFGLAILLIIPAVIFGVYWAVSSFVFIGENARIGEALSKSKSMIKGKWWKTFGYAFLMILIIVCISILFSLPSDIFIRINKPFSDILEFFGSSVSSAITTPLFLLFFKNYYLEIKGKEQAEKPKKRTKRK